MSLQAKGLPRFNFTLDSVPPRDRFLAWREGARPVFEVAPLPGARPPSVEADVFRVDTLLVNENRITNVTFRHGSRECREHADHLVLQVFLEGEEQVRSDHGEHLLRSGNIYLRDFGRAFTSRSSHSRQLGIAIPRALIRASDWTYTRAPTLRWGMDSPEGAVLAAACRALWSSLPNAPASSGPVLSSGFIGLLNGLLSGAQTPAESERLQLATLDAMRRYIIANLDLPELDVWHLCAEFACSRAKVYRLFQESGGVQQYIRGQRLARCLRDLTQADPKRCKVNEVAQRWGFFDPSGFSKLFQRTYGALPSDVLQHEVSPMDTDPREHGALRTTAASLRALIETL